MIEAILKAVAAKKRLLILTHNNPDPDAMGAAFALKTLLYIKLKKKCTIAYMGMIGRLENREFVRQCKIDMVPSFGLNFRRFDYIILVDSQPQAGNVYIPSGYQVDLVVDHHLVKKALPKRKDFIADIRPTYGSTCSILSEYYKKLGLVPDANVATALCTGITTDAIGSGRDSGKVDQEMLGFIYPYVSLRKLAKIKSPELPRYHFKTLRRAIENAVIIDELLYCDLGDVRNSDLIAESADYLLRMREVKCVFVVGILDKVAMFSLRYKSTRKSVGRIAMRMVKGIGYGGGHVKSAGGQVPLGNREYEDVVSVLKTRLVKYLGIKSVEEKTI
ncbi:MAG: DHH family phosphoesterase [Deferribacteraceae bacterium]|nr:DHH family phosphoesterase [Deferribacteraceae bacterium]